MNVNLRLGTLAAAAGALAVAVPAAAHRGPSSHPGQTNHPSKSHRCAPHNVAYIESGAVDATTASTLAKNPDGTWSGTLAVDVSRTNHWAKQDRGTTVTYSFTGVKLRVHFDGGTTGFASGDRIKLIGKLAVVAKKCPPLSPASTPAFRTITVRPLATSPSHL